MWYEDCFKNYIDHYNDEPNELCAFVTVLCSDVGMAGVLNFEYPELGDEFINLVEETGFSFELQSYGTALFYTVDEKLNSYYLEYFEWQWILKLIKLDYTSLYSEIFEYFHINPKKLYSLSSRQFEVLVGEIFKNQGYFTELGSGQNDGGIDLKLYQKDEIDQIVTLVQVKKYKEALPIKLESVAFLQSIVDEEKANRGLFITTSRYLPQAQKFALRQKSRLILANSNDVAKWCDTVKTKIIRDKSISISDDYIKEIINNNQENGFVGKIVVGRKGVNMIYSDFCIVLKDSLHVTLLMRLPTKHVSHIHPPYTTRGFEAPLIDESIFENKNKENVFRAEKKFEIDGRVSFWGQTTLYFLWDGNPTFFDYND